MADISVLPMDDRPGQILRVADFMEQHPEGVTIPQIDAACDTGSTTKLVSDMRKKMGYLIRAERIKVPCVNDTKLRPRNKYILLSRPTNAQPDLFEKQ